MPWLLFVTLLVATVWPQSTPSDANAQMPAEHRSMGLVYDFPPEYPITHFVLTQ